MIRAHTAIPVTNLDRAKSFYSKLGFREGESWERPEWKMSGHMMEHPSGFSIELILHPGNNTIQHPVTPEVLHMAIPVQNMEQLIPELVDLGGTILQPVTAGINVQSLAFVKDPDGFAIELFEPKP